MKTTSLYHGFQLQVKRYGTSEVILYQKGKVYRSRAVAEKQISKIIDKDHSTIPDDAPFTPEVMDGHISEIEIIEWFDS